jgi:hypothetical protein
MAESQLHPPALERAGRIRGRRGLERREEPVQAIHQNDPRRAPGETESVVADSHVEELSQGPRHLDASGATTHHHERQQPVRGRVGIGVGVLETTQDMISQRPCVTQRVEREGELRGPRNPEITGRGSAGHDHRVEGQRIRSLEIDPASVPVDSGDRAESEGHVLAPAEDGPPAVATSYSSGWKV